MQISKHSFGTLSDGREVFLFTLKNKNGVLVSVSEFGAALTSVLLPDRKGVFDNVILGFDRASEYEQQQEFVGMVPGRYANRIRNARFTLNGREHILRSQYKNQCHGGIVSFAYRLWKGSCNGDKIVFSLHSPDGDEGFPGNLDVSVTYSLSDENALTIQFTGRSDQDTVLNLTNHAYFNLKGRSAGFAEDQLLQIFADFYTPMDTDHVPTGEIHRVDGTIMDFRTPRLISSQINCDDGICYIDDGYDHNYVLRKPERDALSAAAVLTDPVSGRFVRILTTKPGAQFFSVGGRGKDGNGQIRHSPAVCIETQFFPNSPEITHFPTPTLRANESYDHTTVFQFGVDK